MSMKPIPSEDDIRLLYVFACAEQAYPDTRAEVAKMERQAEGAWSAFLARVRRDAAREALDVTEHRIARLEAQTDIRGRAVVMYRERAREAEAERDEWRQTALDERAAALDQIEQVKIRDARIKAVRDMHYPAHNDPTRTPFCETCKGAPGIHECGCWQDEQQLPVCGHCRGWKGMGPVEWPCGTIRALD